MSPSRTASGPTSPRPDLTRVLVRADISAPLIHANHAQNDAHQVGRGPRKLYMMMRQLIDCKRQSAVAPEWGQLARDISPAYHPRIMGVTPAFLFADPYPTLSLRTIGVIVTGTGPHSRACGQIHTRNVPQIRGSRYDK
jgi:hypothetical protein